MGKAGKFEDLQVWQDAIALTVEIYKLIESTSLVNNYGLRDQINRASISISSNIAEGFEYDNNKEFMRFLSYAKGSCGEVRSQLQVVLALGIADATVLEPLISKSIEISKQIAGFRKYLRENKQYLKEPNLEY